MDQLKPTKTVYTVSEFLDWQKNGTLRLKPIFQRREVWNKKAKSLLIDTVVKGLPIPIIFLRKKQDLKTLSTEQEVVDGQQRLRTLFSFIEPKSLRDYDQQKDYFLVLESHNDTIAGIEFKDLPRDIKENLLGYEISTHVFPPSTNDEAVLRIFARLNSTGLKLNEQELRNSQFYGEFKSLAYDLAFNNLERWRKWGIFSDDDFARMHEVETVSDLLCAMMFGVQGKSQPKLTKIYSDYDDELSRPDRLRSKFQKTMDSIELHIGHALRSTRLCRQVLFYSLFTACYDHMYGLNSDYRKAKTARPLPGAIADKLLELNKAILTKSLPDKTQDAMDRATSDLGRRKTRHLFFMKALGLAAAK